MTDPRPDPADPTANLYAGLAAFDQRRAQGFMVEPAYSDFRLRTEGKIGYLADYIAYLIAEIDGLKRQLAARTD